MRQNLDAMRVLPARRSEEELLEIRGNSEDGMAVLYEGKVDFSGFCEDEEACVRELVQTSDDVVVALREGGRALASERVKTYLDALERNLDRKGLAGWVACRCAVELLQRWVGFGSHIREDAVRVVLERVGEFYGFRGAHFARRYLARERSNLGVPMAFKGTDGKFASVGGVVSRQLANGSTQDRSGLPEWTLNVPLSIREIRPLVERHRDQLSELLRHLGDRMVVGDAFGRRLRVQATQRVLGLCRRCNDQEVLSGAATVLLNAKFGRIANPELVLKILAAARSSQLVSRVLDADTAFDGDEQGFHPDGQLAFEVAKRIVRDRDRYAFGIVNRATSFLKEVEVLVTKPLFQEFPKLKELSA